MNLMVQLIVYTTSAFRCPYCERVKAVLTDHGFSFLEKDVFAPDIKSELMALRPSARTVPQVFLPDRTYVGNCDETIAALESGKLDLLIAMCGPVAEIVPASGPKTTLGEALLDAGQVLDEVLDNPLHMPEHDLRLIIAGIWGGFPQEQRTADHVMRALERIYPNQYDEQRARELASQIG